MSVTSTARKRNTDRRTDAERTTDRRPDRIATPTPPNTASAGRSHTLGTALINKDVPQEVVRRILDHESPQMTAHYANSRVLQQAGEKPQVSRSWRCLNSVADLRVTAT